MNKKLVKYLEDNKVKYELLEHRTVYTAHDVAATLHVKLGEIAKSLLVKFNKPFEDGKKPYALAVVAADKNIDLKKLSKVVSDWAVRLNRELRLKKLEKGKKPVVDIYNKVAKVILPKEKDMKDKFKVGAGSMSAFGSFYKLPVFVDKSFTKKEKAIFAAGNFEESVKLPVAGFVKIEQAMVGAFAVGKKVKKVK
ncbi:MAG TPA: YbaK/EbsC family protein [Patescibacteria group bacterium]|nr:YbaK/EbsC family protein [Patescibacteria group bacterium]